MGTGHGWNWGVAALAGYLAIVLPLTAWLAGPGLRHRLAADPSARAAFYRAAISTHSSLALTALVLTIGSGAPPRALGLRAPGLAGGPAVTGRLTAGVLGAAALASALALLLRRRPGAAGYAWLLPTTVQERRGYVAVAITAGCVEELLYRGFLMLFLTDVAGWGRQEAALVSAIAFGLGHGHQGVRAVAAATLAGIGLAEIYLATQSLLLPMIAHVVIGLWPIRRQKCKGASAPSMRPPTWKTVGLAVSTPSPATNSRVGSVADA